MWGRVRTFAKSIRFQLVAGVVIIILPFCIYFIYNNIYTIGIIRDQVANANKKLTSLYMQEIDSKFKDIDIYLSDNIMNDTNFLNIQYQSDEDQKKLNELKIYNKLSNDLPQYSFVNSIFVYSASTQDYTAVYNPDVKYTTKTEVTNYIISLLNDQKNLDSYLQNYFTAEINHTFYIFHIMKNNNVFTGVWVSIDKLVMPIDLINAFNSAIPLFVDSKGVAMNDKEFVSRYNIDLKRNYSSYYLSNGNEKFLVIGQKSSLGNFSLVVLIPDRQILGNLSYLDYIVVIMSVFTFLMIFIFLVFLRKTVLNPSKRIMEVMKQIQSGDMDARIKPFHTSRENEVIYKMFNNMMDQIKELKISVYEEQIGKQKEELEHLQLQIRPHFIMNSLNVIHSLAQIKDYRLIQEMSLCLSEYFAYISKKKVTLVRLDEELQHIKNYIRIQELRFSSYFTHEIQVPDKYFEVPVPPLIIQTFVENTIKYAITMDEPVHLSIQVTPVGLECGEGIRISITNTGDCFDEKTLELIRAGKRIVDSRGEHIGIWNAQRRLELIYSGNARMRIGNLQPKGVLIEIDLPVQP